MMNKIDFKILKKVNEEFGDFDIGQVFGGMNQVYLRFGYWNKVDIDKLNEILNPANSVWEDEDYDDRHDCNKGPDVPYVAVPAGQTNGSKTFHRRKLRYQIKTRTGNGQIHHESIYNLCLAIHLQCFH